RVHGPTPRGRPPLARGQHHARADGAAPRGRRRERYGSRPRRHGWFGGPRPEDSGARGASRPGPPADPAVRGRCRSLRADRTGRGGPRPRPGRPAFALVVERRRRWPAMHVYHYGGYESGALKRLMGRHAIREDELDTLLRGRVLVDLYSILRQGLRVSDESYSLKRVEKLYMPRREGP